MGMSSNPEIVRLIKVVGGRIGIHLAEPGRSKI